jgi:hypothetical protein
MEYEQDMGQPFENMKFSVFYWEISRKDMRKAIVKEDEESQEHGAAWTGDRACRTGTVVFGLEPNMQRW